MAIAEREITRGKNPFTLERVGFKSTPEVIIFETLTNRKYVSAYKKIAEGLTDVGLGSFKIQEAERQVTPDGVDLNNHNLVLIERVGQKDWSTFWHYAHEAKFLIDDLTDQGKNTSEVNSALDSLLREEIYWMRDDSKENTSY